MKPGYVLVALTVAGLIVGRMDYLEEQDRFRPAPLDAKEQRIAERLIAAGSPHPADLARTCAKLKRPRLAMAQAIVESNGNKHAIGKAGERGVWQVIEREWGVVPDHLHGQARQYEEIMEALIRESNGDLRKALSRYNGDRSGRYAAKVLRAMYQVPA